MRCGSSKIAGLLLFVGGIQCIIGITIAEALYPGYSISKNYISDLGVGPSAGIFNSSVFLFGVFVIFGAYFFQQRSGSRIFPIMVALAGVGATGVSLFTENTLWFHMTFSIITFAFGGISALASYRFVKPPLSYASIALGVDALASLFLMGSGVYLGLGVGGIERMIAYPELLWTIGFGAYFIGDSSPIKTK